MQWESLNHIILPLFISTATPVEKERDAIMNQAHKEVLAYCKDMPMAKQKDYSYPCRLQIEADCLEYEKNKACDLLAKLKFAEKDARDKQLQAREKKKDSTFWCVVKMPEDIPGRFFQPGEGIPYTPRSINLTSDEEMKKFSQPIQDEMMRLRRIAKKISAQRVPINCSKNSDCKVEGVGQGCGRHFVAYSATQGQPQIIQDILTFDQLDDQIKAHRGDLAECAVMIPEHFAVCRENMCSSYPKDMGY